MFSQTSFGGSARIQGIAGAQTALGGDISNLGGNPAGIGMYRRSDFSISPAFNLNSTKTQYLGSNTPGEKDQLNIGSMGIVFAQTFADYNGNDRTTGWVSAGLGFGFNKINYFTNQFTAAGLNKTSSLTRYFADQANRYGLDSGSFEEATYFAYLINPDTINRIYIPAVTGNTQQVDKNTVRGGQNDWNISFGANYSNKFYIGGGLSITSLRYQSTSNYSEYGFVDSGANGLRSFALSENRTLSGSGVNARLGVILRPVDLIRIGASVQTPTYYTLSESADETLKAEYQKNSSYSNNFYYAFDYNLRTPYRYQLGIALFAKKYGFISADIEQVDYGQSTYSSNDPSSFDSDKNREIATLYTNVVNYRLGAEAKVGALSFRAGYAVYPNPQLNGSKKVSYTGGVGYRVDDYYIDLGLVQSEYRSTYAPYYLNDASISPVANIKYQRTSVLLTFGTKF